MPQTPERRASIARLESRATELRAEIYQHLTPWQVVQVARHPNRPTMMDYVERLITQFTELAGDRRFADDKAIVTGLGYFHDLSVIVVGHQKGSDTKQKIYRNFGYAKPEGYRKALRVMEMAEQVQAAHPGLHRYARGVPGDRIRRARGRGSDRAQPARDDADQRADRGRGLWRRRQRRRARHRDRRSGVDAGIQHLQRDSSGRVRGNSVARRGAEGRGRRARSRSRRPTSSAWASSTRWSRSLPAARTPRTKRRRRCSTPRCGGISPS